MLSPVRKQSYGSVTIFWLDKKAAFRLTEKAAEELARNRAEVELVKLFGSFATGTATAASDVDILIVVKHSTLPLLDRPAEFLPYFSGVGMPAELFVYTRDEIDTRLPSIAEMALRKGITLWPVHTDSMAAI